VLGGVLYILCVLIEAVIFISHLIWRFRTRKIRAQAKSEGKTFDDISEEYKRENIEFRFAEREVKLPFFSRKREAPDSIETGDSLGVSIFNNTYKETFV
jgi:Na+-transporting methylmalonyl-CoA/oxaloacetate decarboxylase gamma subunit